MPDILKRFNRWDNNGVNYQKNTSVQQVLGLAKANPLSCNSDCDSDCDGPNCGGGDCESNCTQCR